MPKKDKKPSAPEVSKVTDDRVDQPTPEGPPEEQRHRPGKPSNPFLVRHPPPRLGRRR
jgi:hypothetical protein